jgi:hypothetical protein
MPVFPGLILILSNIKFVINLSCCAKKCESVKEQIKVIRVFFNCIIKFLKITKKLN